MLQNLKKLLRADPEIQALGHNWVKIAHLTQKRIFWEILHCIQHQDLQSPLTNPYKTMLKVPL